jgi:hypothetical protein
MKESRIIHSNLDWDFKQQLNASLAEGWEIHTVYGNHEWTYIAVLTLSKDASFRVVKDSVDGKLARLARELGLEVEQSRSAEAEK